MSDRDHDCIPYDLGGACTSPHYGSAPSGDDKSPRASALDEARSLVTGDRNNQYGPPTQDFSRTASMASGFGFRFVSQDGAEAVPLSPHHVAIFLILLKMSRLAWTPGKRDSWVDTAGYAGCGYECAVEAEKQPIDIHTPTVLDDLQPYGEGDASL